VFNVNEGSRLTVVVVVVVVVVVMMQDNPPTAAAAAGGLGSMASCMPGRRAVAEG